MKPNTDNLLPITELYGLIVCGGKSSRMGQDKCMLIYHHKQQAFHLFTMLETFCKKVYISCNKRQINFFPENIPTIIDLDVYLNIGPMAALLSAFSFYPNANFIMLGCDYPFLKTGDIKQLIDSIDKKDSAVSFYNSETEFYEPLLSYYSSACYPLLKESFNQKNNSLQKFLTEIKTKKIIPTSLKSIISVDTPENYFSALKKLKNL